MSTLTSKTAVVLALALGAASTAWAQVGVTTFQIGPTVISSGPAVPLPAPLIQPAPVLVNPAPAVPRLGFFGFLVPGQGLQVRSVSWGSKAAATGLEPGDVILRVNGVPMSYAGAYERGLGRAAFNGGWVTLLIRDWRTGGLAIRRVNAYW